MVVKDLKLKAEPDYENLPDFVETTAALATLLPQVKDIALNAKKNAAVTENV